MYIKRKLFVKYKNKRIYNSSDNPLAGASQRNVLAWWFYERGFYQICFLIGRPVETHFRVFTEVSVFFSTKTKQNIFADANVFVSSTCPHWCVCIRKRIVFDTLSPIVHTKMPENADASESIWRGFRHRFQKPSFSPVHFRNGAFSKRCVFSIFERFSTCGTIKKHAFSKKNALISKLIKLNVFSPQDYSIKSKTFGLRYIIPF